jgi:hypothetical protein
VLLAARGHTVAAVVLALAAFGAFQARSLSPTFDARFGAAVRRLGVGAGRVLSVVLLASVFVLVFVPASAVAALARRPLGGRPVGGWRAHLGERSRPRRTFAVDRARNSTAAPTVRHRVLVALGAVLAVVTVDLAVGAVLSGTHVLEPADRGDLRRLFLDSLEREERPAAWASEPFAEALDAELVEYQLERGDLQSEPFLGTRVHEFHGRYVNTTDEERVSYQPEVPAGVEPLRIAFFGGSVMFGLGQRDEHTIPSAFARVAEAHGVAVEVHNYGLPRWVAWQELLYLERLLARGERYDLAIFLDGYNEFATQASSYLPDPTHYTAAGEAELSAVVADDRGSEPGFLDGLDELVDTYRRNSAVWRVVDEVRGVAAPLPGASVAVHGTPEQQTAAALDVYARAVDLVELLAGAHELPVRFFWQPREGGWPEQVIAGLPAGDVDLSHVFDGQEAELYYDGIHTNERGARLLAEALWDQVEGELAD